MARRMAVAPLAQGGLCSPGLLDAPVLELMCSRFVLLLATAPGVGFNVRRDAMGVVGVVGRHLVWPQPVLRRFRAYLEMRCRGIDAWRGHETLADAAFLARFGVWRGSYDESTLFYHLDDYARENAKDLMAVLSATGQHLEQVLKKQSTQVEKNIDSLAGILQLNRGERALLLYGTLARYQRDMRAVLVEFKVSSAQQAYQALADVAGVRPEELGEALRAGSRLERIGLLENLVLEHNITDLADLMKVSEKLPPVLLRQYRDPAELMAVFTRRSVRSSLMEEDFAYLAADVQAMQSLLRHAAQTQAQGVNVLIYGPAGTGKTELARVLAQSAGLDLYEVEYADRDGNALSGRDRYRSLQIAQVFLRSSAQAALLFDEVEDVFPAPTRTWGWDGGADTPAAPVAGKAWVNQVLESNTVPTLWVTNHIEHIDPAYRRRFAYHLELRTPPPQARARAVASALDGLVLREDYVRSLVQRKELSLAHVQTAARFARLAAGALADSADWEALMERQLRNASAAMGERGMTAPRSADSELGYDPALLNLKGRFGVDQIERALRQRPRASLCLYGPPGTGKSGLAHHLAHRLGRTLLVRRASELLGKYVGETEQALAAMFRQAQAQSAWLLLDEADSFLQDRRTAQRGYEVSAVNELLQGMEQFDGVLVCTTNLLDQLDAAALRRFTFKLELGPLDVSQRKALFVQHACAGDSARLNATLARRLDWLDGLCLGDFAVVQAQALALQAHWSAQEFLEQLEAEHRLKPDTSAHHPLGFVPTTTRR